MPFYKIAEMQQNPSTANPQQFVQTAVGEFMKAGIVTKPEDEGPPLHMHPNEEQFTLVLDGKLRFVLGDEERIKTTPKRPRPRSSAISTATGGRSPAHKHRQPPDRWPRGDA